MTTELTEATNAVRSMLSVQGPMVSSAILDGLAKVHADRGGDLEELLSDVLVQDDVAFVALPDGRWGWAPALLDGRVFTHQLTNAEAVGDFIELGPDILPLYPLCLMPEFRELEGRGTGVLVDGKAMVAPLQDRGVPPEMVTMGSVVLFPVGSFVAASVGVGDLVGVRATAMGLRGESVSGPLPTDPSAHLYQLVSGAGEPESLHEAVWQLCADDAGAFRVPAAPIRELAAVAGLSLSPVSQEYVAPPGFDWETWLYRRAGDDTDPGWIDEC